MNIVFHVVNYMGAGKNEHFSCSVMLILTPNFIMQLLIVHMFNIIKVLIMLESKSLIISTWHLLYLKKHLIFHLV